MKDAGVGERVMKVLSVAILSLILAAVMGCSGNSSTNSNPPPPQGFAAGSISLHDMPPMGVTVLAFRATVTGIAMQPGNVSLLNTPMTLEMTQLQGMSAYMGTVSVPAGHYTSMTITLANPRMTFLNDSGGTMGMGGMMGGTNCANGQICQFSPTMMASSVTLSGSPFPVDVQASVPFHFQMDFDLMDSMQSNMGMNPTMTSTMQEGMQNSGMFDEMGDMLGQITSVNADSNQFTMSFVEGMPSMSIMTDANTMFEDFEGAGKPNSFAGLAQGEIVLVEMQLMAGGTLRATEVRLESASSLVLKGIVVGMDNASQFDMVVMNEAPALQGLNIGDVVRMNLQSGATFAVDDTNLPISGMSFGSSAEMMIGQMLEVVPSSDLLAGTPPQLNTNSVRLMNTWVTASVVSKIDSNNFTVGSLPGIFGSTGISSMRVSASAQTKFENFSSMNALNIGDLVCIRGPLFMMDGTPIVVASKIQKR